MAFSTEVLVTEADRLVARVESQVQRHRIAEDGGVAAKRAEQHLKRLRLYRAILTSTNAAQALMPEYVIARGLVSREKSKPLRLRKA